MKGGYAGISSESGYAVVDIQAAIAAGHWWY